MKKNIKCISQAISFVTDHFLFFLYITFPAMLLLALCLTLFPVAAILPLLLLQGVVLRLYDVKRRGLEIRAQRFQSVYHSAIRRLLNPKNWKEAFKYYFTHFKSYISLTICCLFFFGFIAFLISLPQLAVIIIKRAIEFSVGQGDVVPMADHPDGLFFVVLLAMNYLLAILLSDVFLPFLYLREECRREDVSTFNFQSSI